MPTNDKAILSDPTYRIESELGSGGGGVVYKAWHTRLQKHVVIKELKSGFAHDVETRRNEVEALKNVKSAFLPQVFDFLTEGDRVFTVIEFVEGESLDKSLARGAKFTGPQVVKWYGQLASALTDIHKQNVCHRDIKPANIMLTPTGDVCLIDFNAALVRGNDVRLISRSLGYASPEQYEIYERFKNAPGAPIHYGSSSVNAKPIGEEAAATELLPGECETDLGDAGQGVNPLTESPAESADTIVEALTENADAQKAESLAPSETGGVDWTRSDIYSLGATMYHLLTGRRPSERAAELVPMSKLGRFGEGIVYVVEQSMRRDPAERFASASALADAVRNIHKHDTRWKASQSKKLAAAVVLPLAFALFAATAVFGRGVMAQEKEERYYAAVYDIEHGVDAGSAYETAMSMFWDRIDPYRAMAERLWNDGDTEACLRYIDENLGNIAEFQNVPEARRSFGDIYYILGNCYYDRSGAPDYDAACDAFETALRFVTDNPAHYRDFAVSLARTGRVAEAERVLEEARAMGLEEDSLCLLLGEIDFAKGEYDDALENFGKVVSMTDDDYLRYRAYHASDEIHKQLGRPERSVELLSGAMNRIPLDRVTEMTERLADAYAKSGDFGKAIELFERLSEDGAPRFHILQNLAILFQNAGEFDRAAAALDRMDDAFPNDYRVPMRRAYLEADRQSKIKNENRNYALAKRYYDAAAALYKANVKPGENDAEMQRLDALMEELRRHKWI
jgi:serine/threonine-protein kinase